MPCCCSTSCPCVKRWPRVMSTDAYKIEISKLLKLKPSGKDIMGEPWFGIWLKSWFIDVHDAVKKLAARNERRLKKRTKR